MNADAVLVCFYEGASVASLAEALAVPRAQIEQLLRESRRPHPVSAPRPAPALTPTPAGRNGSQAKAGRQAGRQAGPSGRRARRSRADVTEAALTALRQHPGTKTQLMKQTSTTNGTLMMEILGRLVLDKRIRCDQARVYHLVTP